MTAAPTRSCANIVFTEKQGIFAMYSLSAAKIFNLNYSALLKSLMKLPVFGSNFSNTI